ncbi:uncharacterized protein LOC141695896 [Apium graveolens]|uniref:uncharacterized protein LOC141695896 n=1 Tax=Apium graveolens TaxID=4045 RepID=UPI003D7926E1
MSHNDGDEHWRKPMINSIKINSDAAIFEDSKCYGRAYIIRDHEGQLIEARSKYFQGRLHSDLAEVFGIKKALSWIMMRGCKYVIVESDCLQMVQAIRSSIYGYSYLASVIEECCDMLANLRSKNILFRFVKRSANRVAHYLARHSFSHADRTC